MVEKTSYPPPGPPRPPQPPPASPLGRRPSSQTASFFGHPACAPAPVAADAVRRASGAGFAQPLKPRLLPSGYPKDSQGVTKTFSLTPRLESSTSARSISRTASFLASSRATVVAPPTPAPSSAGSSAWLSPCRLRLCPRVRRRDDPECRTGRARGRRSPAHSASEQLPAP